MWIYPLTSFFSFQGVDTRLLTQEMIADDASISKAIYYHQMNIIILTTENYLD